ncbi:hypothetical protein H9L05_19800 [Hymenobacter qilianensis]|uniref:Uncharacterized protein n=1 Tax=Hymenobacter qilianensis TaxID=1385715 RepID=A0A7H0GUY6_9BACT|nr:hypothetical protein [Hymenobacter qilianensis]QNP52102.1 hypothetical protein H9L05_19800 [Hymenobacter qilianensis]
MASNLDYLNPALIPLEEKVKAYLEAEEELEKAQIEARSLSTSDLPPPPTALSNAPLQVVSISTLMSYSSASIT